LSSELKLLTTTQCLMYISSVSLTAVQVRAWRSQQRENDTANDLVFKPQLAIARLRLHASELSICLSVCLSVCLSPKCKKTRFSQKISNLKLWCLLTTYRKSYMGFQRTYYWTPKIQHGGDPPSWIVMPKCKNAIFSKTTQFRAMVAINDP